MRDVILLHSPLLGPSSVSPTAEALRAGGVACHVPSPPQRAIHEPAWNAWPSALRSQIAQAEEPIIVGHSMAGLLAARLASELRASAVICLDANMPPEDGATPPVEPSFLKVIDALPVENGQLPQWHLWWPGD